MSSNLPDILFLCGFMGAGKSTIGQKLSDELEVPFMDLDDRIEERADQTIPEIFEESGEGNFRVIERRALLDLADEYEGVVALGGGSLQNQQMLDHLKLKGLLIFIETPISVILDRISGDENRPLLMDDVGQPKDRESLAEELETLYKDRRPLYEQAAISLKDDGSTSPEELVETLLKKIRNHVQQN